MSKILEGLNNEQKEAASVISGPMLVLAGAGSGKTRVLTQRIAHMVSEGIHPANILAVTFTNKAAKEMKQRLESILGEETVKKLWVGTFHSICGRILRHDIENYKNEENRTWLNNFVIFDQAESLNLIKQALKVHNLDEKIYQPKSIQATISMAKNKMQNAFKFATKAKDFRTEKVAQVFTNYEEMLSANNAVDFDDMLMITVDLLCKCPEVLQKHHSRFKHILVDEFQDTNLAQYRLIKFLACADKQGLEEEDRSLCVVGDVDQSIYSWRGADYKIILNFQKDFQNTKLITLEQNYRSTGNILEVANSIILNNTDRLDKSLYSNKGQGEKITCYEASSEIEEALYIIKKIKDTTRGKYSYNDCAVLYRTNSQSRALEEACMSQSIPYKMVGGIKFYERKEIKDIIAYLKLVHNPFDSQSLKRIINVPKRSIGATTLKKADEISLQTSKPVFEVLENIEEYSNFNNATKVKILEFIKLINYFKHLVKEMPLSEFISTIISDINYIEPLRAENTEEANSRIENIQEFISVVRNHEMQSVDNDLGEFLTQLALVSDLDGLEEESKSVTLMTLHAAKGLEFPVVFLAGLEEGIFPHMRSLEDPSEMEEERRLMYVGVTRAEDILYLTYSKRRLIWGDYKYFTPSRFLNEIPSNCMISNCVENLATPQVGQRKSYNNGKSYHSGSSYGRSSYNYGNYGKPKSKTDYSAPVGDNYSTGFGKGFKAPSQKSVTNTGSIGDNYSSGFGAGFKAPSVNTSKKPASATNINNNNMQKHDAPRSGPVKPKFSTATIEQPVQSVQKSQNPVEKETKQNQLGLNLENTTEPKQEEPVYKPEVKENPTVLNEGDRVFHEKFGMGVIEKVVQMGSNYLYSVDFGKMGKKAVDAQFAKLKKF